MSAMVITNGLYNGLREKRSLEFAEYLAYVVKLKDTLAMLFNNFYQTLMVEQVHFRDLSNVFHLLAQLMGSDNPFQRVGTAALKAVLPYVKLLERGTNKDTHTEATNIIFALDSINYPEVAMGLVLDPCGLCNSPPSILFAEISCGSVVWMSFGERLWWLVLTEAYGFILLYIMSFINNIICLKLLEIILPSEYY